jgi:hypothetical protein
MTVHRKDGRGKVTTDKPETTILPAHVLVEMALSGWDERGWHGGGEQECRATQRQNPKKGNTWRGKQAHRMPYGPKRTW